MLLRAYLTAKYLYEDVGVGWGWLLLFSLMAKTITVGADWRHQVTFIAIIGVMVASMILYFYLRKRYYDKEKEVANFKVWPVSLKAGFWSFTCFYALLFVVLLADKLV